MAGDPYSRPDPNLYPGHDLEALSGSAVSFSAIAAGTIVAIALTVTLGVIGAGFGLASVSAWPGASASAKAFTIGAGVWLIVTQWLSAAVGGYIAGRLRTRWHGLHTDEVFFRDTAHGFVTWALASLVVALVAAATSAVSSLAPVPADVTVTLMQSKPRARRLRPLPLSRASLSWSGPSSDPWPARSAGGCATCIPSPRHRAAPCVRCPMLRT